MRQYEFQTFMNLWSGSSLKTTKFQSFIVKVCSFWSCSFPALCSSEHTCARESSSKAEFPANVFHEITGITDELKKNAYDQNELTI